MLCWFWGREDRGGHSDARQRVVGDTVDEVDEGGGFFTLRRRNMSRLVPRYISWE